MDKKETMVECLKKCIDLEHEEVDFDKDIQEYGMNSITTIKFLVLVENELDIEFDVSAFSLEENGTLCKILDHINNM